MIDPELIDRKLLLIGKDLEDLANLSNLSEQEYLADRYNELLAERYIERIIGRMIDINFHLLTESGQPPPPDYYQSFTRLSELGVYERPFGEEIAKSAGLRNRIVHEYDEIDAVQVYRALKAAINDIPEYMRAVLSFVAGSS